MLQMSSQLPLTEAAAMPNGVQFAFASGLAVKGNTVIITYGAGDRDARALVMTLEKLDVPWPWPRMKISLEVVGLKWGQGSTGPRN